VTRRQETILNSEEPVSKNHASTKLSRRKFGMLAAAAPAAVAAAAPRPQQERREPTPEEAAAERRRTSAEVIAKFNVPMETEPGFVFRP
jgi:hypothetical protein